MLRFENKSNGRFYYMDIKNEYNQFVIRITRGGRHVCIVRDIVLDGASSMAKEINRLTKRRVKRGYSLVT